MSQFTAVSGHNVESIKDERTQSRQSESSNQVGHSGDHSQRHSDHLQDKGLDTLAMRTGAVGSVRGPTSLGQVIVFLIELADKDAPECRIRE